MLCLCSLSVSSRKLRPLLVASLFSTTVVAVAGPALPAPARSGPARPAITTTYLLGPNDTIDITVSNHADLNSTIKIAPDGRITMARAGVLMAQGKTSLALANEIEKKLSRTLRHAHVQVMLKEAAPRQAQIAGAVKNPGPYTVKTGWRVTDLIGSAGGLTTKPVRITGHIIRQGKSIDFDVNKALAERDSASNMPILPDDSVQLDAQDLAKIIVTGSVATPGSYDYDEEMTLVSLLAHAGNPTGEAALRKAYIKRRGQLLPLDLSQSGMLTPQVASFVIQPGDELIIPQNQARVGVLGQVARPAYYTLPEGAKDATLLKLLSGAGGPTPDGDLEKVTIIRDVDGVAQVIPINAAAIVNGTAPDVVNLQPNDLINVPKRDAQVTVIGPVKNPGAYPYTEGMTLISLLGAAGNPAASAGLSRAYILRGDTKIPVNLRAALIEGNDQSVGNLKLQNKDFLVIPDTGDEVTVTGQVIKPGSYSLDDNLSVISLLSRAGNTTTAASLSNAYVLRQDGQGGDKQIPLNLRSVLGSGTPDPDVLKFRFEAGDKLVIPENQLRFNVMGAVTRPGAYPYPEAAGEATLIKALGMAGGPVMGSGGANLKKASVVRIINGQPNVREVDLSTLFTPNAKPDKNGQLATNFVLQPGDTIYIPARRQGGGIGSIFGPIATLGTLALGF